MGGGVCGDTLTGGVSGGGRRVGGTRTPTGGTRMTSGVTLWPVIRIGGVVALRGSGETGWLALAASRCPVIRIGGVVAVRGRGETGWTATIACR